MRSHLPRRTTALLGLALAATGAFGAPTVAGAQDDTTGSTIVAQTLPELAPGESPDGAELESGPVLTLPPPSTTTTDVVPAGPVVFDPTPSSSLDDNLKTVMFLLILTAVPSLTVGTALWLHRDRATSPRR
ncbi:MAG: hypothetical protein R2733_24885 [Acidimicrobiales bacterium]